MSNEMWNLFDLISVVGYPVVGWVCWKAGHEAGILDAVESLHEQGLIELDEEEENG